MKWKTLSSEYIVKKPWATLRVDNCELPDGRIANEYYVLEYPNWANAVAITESGEMIMVRQYRHSGGITSLEIPGGVIENGEEPVKAIERELLEETGYAFDKLELISTVYPNPATSNNVCFCYLATGGKKVQAQSLDEHEDISVELFSIETVKQMLLNNQIPQSLHTTGLFYAFLKIGEIKG
ncbi:MAG: NUDIX hydrolase [Sphingobacteriales bacterium]|nr:MAG: NUDIX hydrolase [Sphingobacteriales bacterium]TAF80653.1 MAG: NUDIX hydrolase [Sphingobacteriales bacterium]